jgi:hypothetical protein
VLHLSIFFLPKVDSQIMCQSWMESIFLKNVSLSHRIVTHDLRTTFGCETLLSRAFLIRKLRSATLIKFFFSKVDSQMICQSWMRSIFLENVSPSHGMMTHDLRNSRKSKRNIAIKRKYARPYTSLRYI